MADTVIYSKDLYDYYGLCNEKLEIEYVKLYKKDQKRKKKNKQRIVVPKIGDWYKKKKNSVPVNFKNYYPSSAEEREDENNAWGVRFDENSEAHDPLINTDIGSPLSELWGGIFGSNLSGVTPDPEGAENAFHSLFVVNSNTNTTMMSMHEVYAVTGANPYNTPPTLGDGLSHSIIVGTDADADAAERASVAVTAASGGGADVDLANDISMNYWKNEFIDRWNSRGGAVISDPGIELIYILHPTPWWKNKNTTDVLQEINAVRNYNKYMRILCNLEIGANITPNFDYTLGGPTDTAHSQTGYNVHIEINKAAADTGASLIKDIISKFVDELNAMKCDINLINDKGVVDVTGVMGCIGVKLDEFIYSDSANNDKMSHFLRHLVPFIDTDTNNKGGGLAMASFSDFEAEKYSDISANR